MVLKRKKAMSLSLVSIVALSAIVSACSAGEEKTGTTAAEETRTSILNTSAFPIVNQEVSLKVFGCKDPNHAPWKDVLVLKEYEKKTGMKMVYEETPSQGCDEKRNLLFASNELPDVFFRANLSNTDISRYGMQEQMLVPLEGLIEKYAPNLKKVFDQYPDVKKSVTAADGHIYSLPGVRLLNSGRMDKTWINKTWLDKLNLKPPTNQEELFNVLRAFRDQDPNGNGKKDEIPLGLRDTGMIFTTFSGSFGLERQFAYNINIEDNKVRLWVGDDRYKELLMFLNKLYSEKLLWADFYAGDLPKWRSNLSQALIGMFFIQASDPFTKVESQFTGLAPIKGPRGDQKYSAAGPLASPIGTFAITRNNKHPEAAIRWVDYFFSEEGSIFFQYGIEGQTYTMKDGKPVLNDSILNDSRGLMGALGQVNLIPGGGLPMIFTDKTGSIVENAKTQEVGSFVEKYISKTIYGAPIFD
ncbi:MAG: extracellular solute-binding protein, partial [Paenibacillus sp.]|nr:extracellular solute-binding protein [Paenibacillus sp.]